MSSWSRGAAVAVMAVALLAVAALAGRVILAEPEPRVRPTPAVSRAPFPSAEASFDLQIPLTTTQVAAGKQVRIDGTGPRQIAWTATDGHPVVADIDCALCTGLLSVVSNDRPVPLYTGTGPWAGGYLFGASGTGNSMIRVDAAGRWIVTLTSVPDLKPVETFSGDGARVVAVDATGATVAVTGVDGAWLRAALRPLPGPGGIPSGSTAPAPTASAQEAAGVDVRLPLTGPALVVIESSGGWRLRVER